MHTRGESWRSATGEPNVRSERDNHPPTGCHGEGVHTRKGFFPGLFTAHTDRNLVRGFDSTQLTYPQSFSCFLGSLILLISTARMESGKGGKGGPVRPGGKGEHGAGPYGGGGKGRGGKGRGGGGRHGGGGGGGGGRGGRFERAKNDYAQHFVDTGLRPANFIRDSDVAERFEEYPKLKELIEHKDALITERATPPTYKQCDLKTFDLATLGTKFDVIVVDPPWEEYRQRKIACGGLLEGEQMEVWTPQEIMNLRVEAIAETPSFCFLWCGSGAGLTWGRACLRKWGFRRCEDICWIKSNRESGRNHHWLPNSVVASTSEHCLVGIKGTVRRSYDGHVIHANVDTDVMLSEEPPQGAMDKPAELYSIIEHFSNGTRRLELFGQDHNIRRGWLTLGSELSSSNHDPATWAGYFAGKPPWSCAAVRPLCADVCPPTPATRPHTARGGWRCRRDAHEHLLRGRARAAHIEGAARHHACHRVAPPEVAHAAEGGGREKVFTRAPGDLTAAS